MRSANAWRFFKSRGEALARYTSFSTVHNICQDDRESFALRVTISGLWTIQVVK